MRSRSNSVGSFAHELPTNTIPEEDEAPQEEVTVNANDKAPDYAPGQIPIDERHSFIKRATKKLTWCYYCSDFVWGLISKQVYCCIDCKYTIHPKCLDKAYPVSRCEKTPSYSEEVVMEKVEPATTDSSEAETPRARRKLPDALPPHLRREVNTDPEPTTTTKKSRVFRLSHGSKSKNPINNNNSDASSAEGGSKNRRNSRNSFNTNISVSANENGHVNLHSSHDFNNHDHSSNSNVIRVNTNNDKHSITRISPSVTPQDSPATTPTNANGVTESAIKAKFAALTVITENSGPNGQNGPGPNENRYNSNNSGSGSDPRENMSPRARMSKRDQEREFFEILDSVLSKDDPQKIYVDFVSIGTGVGGQVYLATIAETGEKVALKITDVTKQNLKIVANELRSLSKLDHENIVRMRACYFVNRKQVWVAMDYFEKGSLETYLPFGHLHAMSEPAMAYVCTQILRAVKYMHQVGCIHRDIKCSNILVSSSGSIVLADMGAAAQLTDESPSRCTVIGTPYWMSPELIMGKNYDHKVDIWSLGIVLREMAEGNPPFGEQPPYRALYLISSQELPPLANPENWSSEYMDFLTKCLYRDPSKRPESDELLGHPFVAKACSVDQFLVFLTHLKLSNSSNLQNSQQ